MIYDMCYYIYIYIYIRCYYIYIYIYIYSEREREREIAHGWRHQDRQVNEWDRLMFHRR